MPPKATHVSTNQTLYDDNDDDENRILVFFDFFQTDKTTATVRSVCDPTGRDQQGNLFFTRTICPFVPICEMR